MKHFYFDRYWLIAIVILLCSTHLFAADLITDQVVINLESAGTLPNKISDTDKNLITNLKVTGDMNGTDLLFIREMAGRDANGDITRGKLKTLDLEDANVPNNVIEESQFNSTKIESVILPTSVQILGWYAFLNCISLKNIKLPNNLKNIGKCCFQGCTSLKSIELPNSVTSIGEWGFSGCSSLKAIILPEELSALGSMAFQNCTSLTSIDIPESIGFIEEYTFFGCNSLISVTLPSKLTSIRRYAFGNCCALASIKFPKSLISIQEYAFSGCSSLASVELPKDLESIGKAAFISCTGLKTIVVPNGIVTIESSTFSDCASLTSVTLPDKLKYIGWQAFSNCNSLSSINMPNSVETIESYAFGKCFALKSITIPEGIKSVRDNSFYYCTSLTSVTLPNSLKNIESQAFIGCESLTSITMPNNLETIEDWAFGGCSALETITIPATVTQIGNQAFDCCTSLTQIISLATKAPTIDGAFFVKNKELYGQVCLTVPVGATGYAEGEWAKLKRIASPTVCELTDDNSTITPATYATGNLSYSRSGLKAGNYATFCLPFETNLSDVADAFDKFYTTNGTALCKPNGMLMLMLKSIGKDEVIPAGQPFLAKVSGTTSTVTFKNAKMKIIETEQATNPDPVSLQIYDWNGVSGLLTENNSLKVSFGGTLTTTTGEGTKLESFNTDGSFGPAKNGVLKPFRSFVSKENAAAQFVIKSISIGLEDGNKVINISNDKEKDKDNCVYTIDGRLINTTGSLKNLPSGIYILNGKKISIK